MHTDLSQREDELAGKTMGIYGYGTIGRSLARRARAFDMKVIGFKRNPAGDPGQAHTVVASADFRDSLNQLDILVLTCPLTDETRDLMNAEAFNAMRPGSFFVNVARGGCVVEADLIAASNNGQLAGAGIDVTDPEPYPKDGALWTAPNILITPHMAGDTRRYEKNVIDLLINNLERLLQGEKILINQII